MEKLRSTVMDQPLSTVYQTPVVIPAQCTMRSSFSPAETGSAQCPVPRDPSTLDPRNNMPFLSQSPAPNQVQVLPVTRTMSSIPRAPNATYPGMKADESEAQSKWEYPSPQQFYNALLRKGWNTPEEYVEAMVLIHNRLNEDAWNEVITWETRIGGTTEAAKLELAEFAGLHGSLSNKARLYQLARRFFPSRLSFAPPFDRHDWIVRRPRTNKKVRYVIDYYSSRKSVNDETEFHLDVRPAMDSVENILVRLVAAIEDVTQATKVVPYGSGSSLPRNLGLVKGVFLLLFVSFTFGLLKTTRAV